MYQYDAIDETLVRERTDQFREQVSARLSGELTEDQFKPLRLQNGVYLQLHAYMLRVAIPYGVLNAAQMRKLAHVARTYDKGYGHFTTRQNIQYNWPRLVDVPDILDELAQVDMHAIQTSGNCIRNTTTDPFAGAAADEVADPRPWCELIRQWSTFHPEFSFLPRKFKIAVTGSPADRAAIGVHDIGLQLVTNQAGEVGFAVYAGGGQGRTPMIAPKIAGFVAQRDLLAYLTAVLRVYNLAGRRDNLYKARIKILVNDLGAEEFARQVQEEFEHLKKAGKLTLPQEEIDRVASYFPSVPADDRPASAFPSAAFSRWRLNNVKPHKVPGRAVVIISLKPHGGTAGDASAAQMDVVADLADRYGLGEIRVTKEQNLVLPHVAQGDLAALYAALSDAGLATANAGLASDIVCCPGLDYCNLANARSIPMAQSISRAIEESGLEDAAGELTIKISGCINACGHHHVANIGLLGVDKKGVEFYQLTLGGIADGDAAIGRIVGRGLDADEAVRAVISVIKTYLSHRTGDEPFTQTLDRIGLEPFKDEIYA
jgi:sulfite reductase (NADPH) hemoprotein beta-component